jgi:hypothetical protein
MVALLEAGYSPTRSEVRDRITRVLNDVVPAADGLDVREGVAAPNERD